LGSLVMVGLAFFRVHPQSWVPGTSLLVNMFVGWEICDLCRFFFSFGVSYTGCPGLLTNILPLVFFAVLPPCLSHFPSHFRGVGALRMSGLFFYVCPLAEHRLNKPLLFLGFRGSGQPLPPHFFLHFLLGGSFKPPWLLILLLGSPPCPFDLHEITNSRHPEHPHKDQPLPTLRQYHVTSTPELK